MNFLLNIDWIKTKNTFLFLLFFIFWISFFIRMSFYIIVNNACKSGISNSSSNLFPALNAGVFLAIDELSKTSPTKSMITRLNSNWNSHDLKTKRASNLIFYGLSKLISCFLLLLILLLFFLFFLFLLFILLLFFLLLFLFLFLLFLVLSFFLLYCCKTLVFETDSLFNSNFTSCKQPNFIKMLELSDLIFTNFLTSNKSSICTQIGNCYFILLFSNSTMISTQSFIINANITFFISANQCIIFL